MLGVLSEKDKAVLEDVCCLWSTNVAQHINLAELNAHGERCQPITTVAGKEVCTFLCIYHWVCDMLTEKARICTKAVTEMLIRQKLDTLKGLVSGYNLTVSITLVASYCNLANQLTQLPHKMVHCREDECCVRWLNLHCHSEPTAAKTSTYRVDIQAIKRMPYFMRCIGPVVAKAEIKQVVKN